jgi:hypothetical protein
VAHSRRPRSTRRPSAARERPRTGVAPHPLWPWHSLRQVPAAASSASGGHPRAHHHARAWRWRCVYLGHLTPHCLTETLQRRFASHDPWAFSLTWEERSCSRVQHRARWLPAPPRHQCYHWQWHHSPSHHAGGARHQWRQGRHGAGRRSLAQTEPATSASVPLRERCHPTPQPQGLKAPRMSRHSSDPDAARRRRAKRRAGRVCFARCLLSPQPALGLVHGDPHAHRPACRRRRAPESGVVRGVPRGHGAACPVRRPVRESGLVHGSRRVCRAGCPPRGAQGCRGRATARDAAGTVPGSGLERGSPCRAHRPGCRQCVPATAERAQESAPPTLGRLQSARGLGVARGDHQSAATPARGHPESGQGGGPRHHHTPARAVGLTARMIQVPMSDLPARAIPTVPHPKLLCRVDGLRELASAGPTRRQAKMWRKAAIASESTNAPAAGARRGEP